jgi:DNA-binding transcriptional MerR regulator
MKMNNNAQNELNFVLTNRESINIIKLSQEIRERRFTIKDVGVAYRWISYWDSKGLLIGDYSEGKWRKFNLVEFVWLKMILKLREFNIPIDKIKWIKENLMQTVSVSELIGQEAVAEVIIKLSTEGNREELIKLFNDKDFMDQMSTQSLNLFENIILDIITFQNSYSILIGSTEIIPIKHSALESLSELKEFNDMLRGSFISISISEILRDYMIREVGITNKNKLALLTREEEKVLEVLRQDNLKSVIIKYGQDKEIELLETVKVVKIDKRARLIDFIMIHGYQDITIKTQNGEIVYCENKKKIMIQKKD